MDFWPFYRLLYRRRGVILAIFLIAIALICAGLIFKFQNKTYHAEAYVEPRDTVAVLQNTGGIAENADKATSLAGQSIAQDLMQNRRIHRKAAELLKMEPKERDAILLNILEQNGAFSSMEENIAKDLEKDIALTPSKRKTDLARQMETVKKAYLDDINTAKETYVSRDDIPTIETNIIKNMTFEPTPSLTSTEGNPQYLNRVIVTALFPNQTESQMYANMVMIAFLENYGNQTDAQANIRIERLKELKAKYQKQLDELATRQTRVVQKFPGGITDSGLINKRLSDKQENLETLVRELESANREVIQLQAQYNALPASTKIPRDDSEDPTLVDAKRQVAKLENTLKQLRDKGLGEENESILDTKAALRASKEELENIRTNKSQLTTVNPNKSAIQGKLLDRRNTIERISPQIPRLKAELNQLRQDAKLMPTYRQEIEKVEGEKDGLSKTIEGLNAQIRSEESRKLASSKAGSINIGTARTTIKDPVTGSSALKTLLYGGFAALILGILAVVGLDAVDNAIRTPQDVEETMGLPICGQIPHQLPDPLRAPRITALDPLSPVSEAYRLLRTDLLFTATSMEQPFQSLMAATSKPGQGATTTISNLAITLAQSGKRVILVDADLRRPKLQEIFHRENSLGLTSLLNGECSLESAIQATDVPNLLLLPSGPLPLNPAELLSSPRMRQLHEELKKQSDFVLFDTPSAIAFSDGLVLSSLVDATIMVVRANDIPRGSQDQVKKHLIHARANIIGVVLNDVDPDRVDSVHYHQHYYPSNRSKNSPPLPALPQLEEEEKEGDAQEIAQTAYRKQVEPTAPVASPPPSFAFTPSVQIAEPEKRDMPKAETPSVTILSVPQTLALTQPTIAPPVRTTVNTKTDPDSVLAEAERNFQEAERVMAAQAQRQVIQAQAIPTGQNTQTPAGTTVGTTTPPIGAFQEALYDAQTTSSVREVPVTIKNLVPPASIPLVVPAPEKPSLPVEPASPIIMVPRMNAENIISEQKPIISEQKPTSTTFIIEGTTARTPDKATNSEKVILVSEKNEKMAEAVEPEKPRVKWTLLNKDE
jgi:capsular exopolysaccharide synthesis family protein